LDTVVFLLGPRLIALATTPTVGQSGPDAARTLARAHFTLVTQRRIAIPHLVGVVLALEDRVLEDEDGIRPTSAPEIVRDYQARVRDTLATAYGAVLDQWGRRPAAGMELAQVIDLVAALADGFSLREVAEPDGLIDEQFAAAVVGLLEAVTIDQ
jgi:hypothetical protein